MTMNDAGILVQLCHDIGLHVAAAFYVGDKQLAVDYVDGKKKPRLQVTHIANLFDLMIRRRTMYGIASGTSDSPGLQRLLFTTHGQQGQVMNHV